MSSHVLTPLPPQLAGVKYNTWIVDSTADGHITSDRNCFLTFVEEPSTSFAIVHGQVLRILGRGTVVVSIQLADGTRSELKLEDVKYCPDAVCNAVSITALSTNTGDDIYGEFWHDSIFLKSLDSTDIGFAELQNGLYILQQPEISDQIDSGICHTPHRPEDTAFTPCNHLFGKDCLADRLHEIPQCPLCKQQVHLSLRTKLRGWRRLIFRTLSMYLPALLCVLLCFALALSMVLKVSACESFDTIARAELSFLCPGPEHPGDKRKNLLMFLDHTRQQAYNTNNTAVVHELSLEVMGRLEQELNRMISPSSMRARWEDLCQ